MNLLLSTLQKVVSDLREVDNPFALVGGLAVSIRTEPRFTRDADLAISVRSDADAEAIIFAMTSRGYGTTMAVEQENTKRLATIRLLPPGGLGVVCDLLFASCGIEQDVVAAATLEDVGLGEKLLVARVGHLIAMKVLSQSPQRPQDSADLVALKRAADENELARAREAIALIHSRGFHRQRSLEELLAYLAQR